MLDKEQKLTAVRLEMEDYKKLERIAEAIDHTVAWCMRMAVQEFIANPPKPVKR